MPGLHRQASLRPQQLLDPLGQLALSVRLQAGAVPRLAAGLLHIAKIGENGRLALVQVYRALPRISGQIAHVLGLGNQAAGMPRCAIKARSFSLLFLISSLAPSYPAYYTTPRPKLPAKIMKTGPLPSHARPMAPARPGPMGAAGTQRVRPGPSWPRRAARGAGRVSPGP